MSKVKIAFFVRDLDAPSDSYARSDWLQIIVDFASAELTEAENAAIDDLPALSDIERANAKDAKRQAKYRELAASAVAAIGDHVASMVLPDVSAAVTAYQPDAEQPAETAGRVM